MEIDCVFCKIIRKKLPADIVYEDEKVLVMVDVDDAVPGHVLVIWKDHQLNASDLSETDYQFFSRIFYLTEKTLLNIVKKKRSLVLKTGGLVSHFHFHLYPVDETTNWEEIKNIFDKKTKYCYQIGEKDRLVKDLRSILSIVIK